MFLTVEITVFANNCELSYIDVKLVKKSNGFFYVDFTQLPDLNYSSIVLVLPKNSILKDLESVEYLNVENSKMILTWTKGKPKSIYFRIKDSFKDIFLIYVGIFVVILFLYLFFIC